VPNRSVRTVRSVATRDRMHIAGCDPHTGAGLIPLHYRQAVYYTLMKYPESGAIRPSPSPWASPILCVPKKNGEVRIAIDYRVLSSLTKVAATPTTRTKEILQIIWKVIIFL